MKFSLALLLLWSMQTAAKPNILFILTDDQGKYMGGLDHMSRLQDLLIQKGLTYSKHFCSTAVCCPSRANIWTGRMPHNTNVTGVSLPYGGYPKVVEAGWNDNYLPIWMQEAGYDTYYVGKLWNSHTPENYNKPYAEGFNGSEFLLDPYTYRYYNAKMTRMEQSHPDRPWMLTVAPNAPHSNGSATADGTHWFAEPEYAPRHANLFKNYKIPRDKSFNTVIEGAVGWVKDISQLSQKEVDYLDEFQRCRLRALQAVDGMIDRLISRLDEAGVLDNTYIFFSTDNGYHLGQRAFRPGKNCGYKTDINVPLIVRGPGFSKGTVDAPTSHTNLAPTFLSLAGAPDRDGLDGKSVLNLNEGNATHKTEHVAIEYWGLTRPIILNEGNTYKGLRLVSDNYSLYYAVWCTNEEEFYNLKTPISDTPAANALMMVLKSCTEDSCRDPWAQLHPIGDVHNLPDALDKSYDAFYANQPRFSFSECSAGYHIWAEGPQKFNVYRKGSRDVDHGRDADEDSSTSAMNL
ncbi:alkaline-phosphatase-like protein [Aspergillus desertorum]